MPPTQSGQDFARQLKRLIQALEASGQSVLPRPDKDLLQSIVEAAARIFGAAASSIALINEQDQCLEFKVAYGAGNESVVGLTIPIDQGLAGYVAMTGQPLAISNVQQDSRFNQDFAASTGYVPRSILATPLLSGDRVIGVMEVLDKIESPSFGLQDMELLGLFANQAAIAIHQSQQYDYLSQALLDGLRSIAGEGELTSALDQTNPGKETGVLGELASTFYAISTLGETEQRACLEILKTFERYARSRSSFF